MLRILFPALRYYLIDVCFQIGGQKKPSLLVVDEVVIAV